MQWVLIVPLALIGSILLLTLILQVKVRLRYDGVFSLWVGAGVIMLKLLPVKKKSKPKKQKKPKKDKEKSKSPIEINSHTIPLLIKACGDVLLVFKRALKVKNFTLHMTVSESDAAQTALTYGKTCSAVSAVFPPLEQAFKIKRSDIAIDARFDGKQTDILLDVTISTSVAIMAVGIIRVLYTLYRGGVFKTNRKGVKK